VLPDRAIAQKTVLVLERVVDSVISHEDLAALSLEECLQYRENTAEERRQFRDFLRDIAGTTYAQPWSPEIEAQIEERIVAARNEISDHAKKMRDAYRSLFKRTLVALAVSAAPALVTTVFPIISPLTALLFGGGPLTAILTEPVKDLLTLWAERDQRTSSLAYLMDLPKASSPTVS
jgi:anti-sigma-K factor RskA